METPCDSNAKAVRPDVPDSGDGLKSRDSALPPSRGLLVIAAKHRLSLEDLQRLQDIGAEVATRLGCEVLVTDDSADARLQYDPQQFLAALADYAKSNMAVATAVAALTASVADLLDRMPTDDLDADRVAFSQNKGGIRRG